MGLRPIVEIMFADFLAIAMDQIVNCAAKMRWALGGDTDIPLVYRTAYGLILHEYDEVEKRVHDEIEEGIRYCEE